MQEKRIAQESVRINNHPRATHDDGAIKKGADLSRTKSVSKKEKKNGAPRRRRRDTGERGGVNRRTTPFVDGRRRIRVKSAALWRAAVHETVVKNWRGAYGTISPGLRGCKSGRRRRSFPAIRGGTASGRKKKEGTLPPSLSVPVFRSETSASPLLAPHERMLTSASEGRPPARRLRRHTGRSVLQQRCLACGLLFER